jgi:hypothetical protein
MGKYGTNLEGFGAFEGGVNADKGAPLVSTSSDGATALLFGPAALREIQAGVANGDFAIPPDAAGDTITAENPLPYWTFTDSSAGAITCAIVSDSGSGSGNILRWTVAANTASKSALIFRNVPIAATRDRAYAYSLEVTAGGATSASTRDLVISLQYLKADQTNTGTAISRTYDFADFINTTTGLFIANTERLNAPADAAYAQIVIQVAATTTNASSYVIDLYEVKLVPAQPMILVAERFNPATYGPGAMWKVNGITSIDTTIPTTLSGFGKLQVDSSSVTVTSPFISTDAGTGIDARLVQTETLIVDGTSAGADQITIPDTLAGAGLTIGGDTNLYRSAANTLKTDDSFVIGGANSNLLARVTATATQSLTNNTATKLTFNTASSTPTTDSYDPQTWFDNANDRIVIGQDGFYTISANVGFATNATGRRLVQIYVNGSDRGGVQVAALSGATTILSASTNVYLAVNDYVEVFALQQSGGALNTVSVTGVYPALSVGRIGA